MTLVRAAGGLVTRDGDHGLEVVVVHRPAYDDWSFPKGKLDPGEDELACALREVHEETDLRCKPVADLGGISYVDGQGRPKVVHYWHMRPKKGQTLRASHEIDEARWVPIAVAEPLLSYTHDRTLLRRLSGEPATGIPVPVFLVRHVKAGEREAWREPDELRPVSKTGRKQAMRLVRLLGQAGCIRLVSSPYLRCIQTLEPLADALGLDVDVATELGEGQPVAGAEAWILAVATDGAAVLSTHGDIVAGVLDRLAEREVPFVGEDEVDGLPKGGVWRLDVHDGHVRRVTALPLPRGPRA
ncbi:MAG TPA: NUDIX hydrolase [Actinomycetota bacterium]